MKSVRDTFVKIRIFLLNRMHSKKVLVAPLDWGLGHTTRCLPLIKHLETLGAAVFFAGNEVQCQLVAQQSPQLHFLSLPGYAVRYARSAGGFLPKMLGQVPAVMRRINAEHKWLLETVSEHRIEGIISDNRYGLWHPQVPSVILCHQLGLHTGLGAFADRAAAQLHSRMLSKFGALWIPDREAAPGLSGKLGHPKRLPAGAKYTGPLSQFEKRLPAENSGLKKLVILLSGPEPQRTILSDLLWEQVCAGNSPAVFVEGKRDVPERVSDAPVEWHSMLTGKELQGVLENASYVVCRGGYTTLMDAAMLHLKLILIPTPGQGEQQYLGQLFSETGRGLGFKQAGFDLQGALKRAADFPFKTVLPAGGEPDAFKPMLQDWYFGL